MPTTQPKLHFKYLNLTQIQPSPSLFKRARAWMNKPSHDHIGYWVKLTKRIYAYREHTGDITFWRESK